MPCQTQERNALDERDLAKHPNILGVFQPVNDIDGCLPSGFLLFGSDATEFDNTEAQPSLRLHRADPGNVKLSTIMATTINANQASGRSLPIKEWASKKNKSLTLWLNTETKFFTSLCEFPVTRLLAIQINLVALCMILAAAAVEQQPAITAVAAITAAGLVYRINQTDKKQQERKGGKK